jgi:hypothetical protein
MVLKSSDTIRFSVGEKLRGNWFGHFNLLTLTCQTSVGISQGRNLFE